MLGLSHEYDSRRIVSDDLDGDGRPDLPVVTGDSFEKHFGLGKAESVEALVVHWPDGSTLRRLKPAIDQYHTVSPE